MNSPKVKNYKFVVLPNPAMSMSEIHSAKMMVDKALGNGYFSEHLSTIDCAWICSSDRSVVGWAAVSSRDNIGILKCVVVNPEHRGKGLGQKFTDIRIKYLRKQEYKLVESHAWVRPDGSCPSCGTLERNDFVSMEEIKGFYDNCKHRCPSCKGECQCVARVYQRKL